eukprot:449106_1
MGNKVTTRQDDAVKIYSILINMGFDETDSMIVANKYPNNLNKAIDAISTTPKPNITNNATRDIIITEENTPQFVNDPSPSNNFKIHIAIDLGTDGTTLAVAQNNEEIDKVFVHTDWNSSQIQIGMKPKTIVLLDEDHNVLAFGEDAMKTYMSVTKQASAKWLLFEKFKMALYDDSTGGTASYDEKTEQKMDDTFYSKLTHRMSIYHDKWINKDNESRKVDICQKITAANGKKIAASIVFVAVFKYLEQKAMKSLKIKGIETVNKNDIQWIVTVPAIWNDKAKYQMRQWTIDAGLVNPNILDQCKIVYESDCASLCI